MFVLFLVIIIFVRCVIVICVSGVRWFRFAFVVVFLRWVVGNVPLDVWYWRLLPLKDVSRGLSVSQPL